MVTTSDIARLLSISPQTVRMYERYGIIDCPRGNENGYRLYDRNAITILIKSRILKSFGFQMKDIASIVNDEEDNRILERFDERLADMRAEMDMLCEKYERLSAIRMEVEESEEKEGTCELTFSPAYYLYPVLHHGGDFEAHQDRNFLETWNRYSFMREDVCLLTREEFENEARQYHILYGVKEKIAERYGFDLTHAQHVPSRRCVKAWLTKKANSSKPIQTCLGFARDYMKERRLALDGDVMFFLTQYYAPNTKKSNHYYALIPVRDEGGCVERR